ncbi:multiple C2 and transmembrane domain-containing protein 2-like isoform X2 [Chiloscyllium plagiosum]|uniref:multiple C2 and transmembrane domain-containing protein 2-like isoform X2 n=1 Tax=Chiloscyllium plagiosum TaxID=36176 RepID=UPI001CB7C443|nr:multiple C2 and transmembrane domain-containing protein 2-like isoform X2 [Chiloscyllium plagiosum]
MESQKDITTWESFRAKTKPFLQNLKKGKMLSKRKEGKKRHLLDQRMSVSEPDMVQVGKTYSESCSRIIVKTSAINYFSSPSTPVKKRDQVMVPQISVSPGHPQKPENSCPEKEACTPTTLPELVKESSSNSAEDLVERSFYLGTDDKYADDLSESTDLESSQSSQFLEQSFEHEEPGREPSACGLPSYLLTIQLKEGRNLVIRDRCGTSDPYVKFKLAGKTLYKSKIMYKNLNPRWDETFVIPVKNLNQKLYVKVYDRDLATDDFMGSAYLSLSELEVNSTVLKQLQLDDPNSLEEDMGEIILEIKLANKPRDGIRNAGPVRKKRGTQTKTSLIQNIRLSDTLRKSQLWDSIVTITLFEGKGFREDAAEGCYVKFRLGEEKYKSKVLYKCTNPQWRERFDFHLFNDRASILEVEVCGKVNQKQEASFGMCKVNLLTFSKGQANCKELSLENGQGSVVLLITIRTCNGVYISDPCVSPLHDETERQQIIQRYCLRNTFQDISDIGFLQVQVVKASNLAAADFAGKSDPFCVLELGNDKLQTHTVYKNLNPAWNKVFSFNIRDIHDVLEVTVFDEDGDKPPDFLGKVAIPLLSIKNGQETAYFLKNRKLGRPEKGVLYLQMDIIYNPIKASIRTFKPKEPRNQEENAKFSRKTLTRNVRRVRNITRAIWNTLQFIQSCFEWHSPQRSLIAFLLYLVIVWTFEIYMIPLAFLLLFAWNYIQKARGKVVSQHYMEDYDVDIDDDDEEDEKDSEKKGLIGKIHMVQDIVITVQSVLDTAASFGERIKNTFNWSVPFLSRLACTVLAVCTLMLYFVPLRYILLIWGIHKFTKKLRNPYAIDNNELLNFLSRIPSDVQKFSDAVRGTKSLLVTTRRNAFSQ